MIFIVIIIIIILMFIHGIQHIHIYIVLDHTVVYKKCIVNIRGLVTLGSYTSKFAHSCIFNVSGGSNLLLLAICGQSYDRRKGLVISERHRNDHQKHKTHLDYRRCPKSVTLIFRHSKNPATRDKGPLLRQLKLVNIPPMFLWFVILVTIVHEVYTPTYDWECPPSQFQRGLKPFSS